MARFRVDSIGTQRLGVPAALPGAALRLSEGQGRLGTAQAGERDLATGSRITNGYRRITDSERGRNALTLHLPTVPNRPDC